MFISSTGLYQTKNQLLMGVLWLFPQDSAQREQAKTPISQFLPGRGMTIYFYSYCLGVQLLISLHLSADCTPRFGSLMGVGTSSTTGSH